MPTAQRGSPFIIRPDGQLLEDHPDLRHISADLGHAYARGQFVGDEILQAVGRRLWEALGADDALAAARTQAGALTLPIVIAGSDAALQRLPWETLHHPTHGFLALADGFTVLRSGDGPAPALPPVARGPLRVLLFTSLPDDLDAEQSRLDVEEEQA
jgi:hypothetical protein